MMRLAAIVAAPILIAGLGQAPFDLPGQARDGARPVPQAVVWLDAPEDAPVVARPKAVLDQRNLSFLPHVLVVQLGTRVEFPNHDRVFHNVFSDRDGKQFNLGLYPVGAVREIPFDRPGLSRIFCNIHPQMSAYLMVVDTPYFAVAGEDGRFRVPEVRQGRYRYHAWRPGGTMLNGDVEARPGAVLEVRW